MNGRLYRSPNDRILAGVAGGMAEAWDLDPALVRVGWALVILATGGLFLVLYIVMALVVPLRPFATPAWSAVQPAPGDPSAPPPTDAAPGSTTNSANHGAPMGADHWRNGRDRRDSAAPLVVGLLLILAGGLFLARQFMPQLNFNVLWPIVVISIGVLLIVAAFARPRQHR
jgi:phage shock protein C